MSCLCVWLHSRTRGDIDISRLSNQTRPSHILLHMHQYRRTCSVNLCLRSLRGACPSHVAAHEQRSGCANDSALQCRVCLWLQGTQWPSLQIPRRCIHVRMISSISRCASHNYLLSIDRLHVFTPAPATQVSSECSFITACPTTSLDRISFKAGVLPFML